MGGSGRKTPIELLGLSLISRIGYLPAKGEWLGKRPMGILGLSQISCHCTVQLSKGRKGKKEVC